MELKAGTTILSPQGSAFQVDEALAAAFCPGDRLVANDAAGLLHIPAADLEVARVAVADAASAFMAMNAVGDDAIVAFYDKAHSPTRSASACSMPYPSAMPVRCAVDPGSEPEPGSAPSSRR